MRKTTLLEKAWICGFYDSSQPIRGKVWPRDTKITIVITVNLVFVTKLLLVRGANAGNAVSDLHTCQAGVGLANKAFDR